MFGIFYLHEWYISMVNVGKKTTINWVVWAMEKEVLYFGDMSRKIVDQTECMMIHASSGLSHCPYDPRDWYISLLIFKNQTIHVG